MTRYIVPSLFRLGGLVAAGIFLLIASMVPSLYCLAFIKFATAIPSPSLLRSFWGIKIPTWFMKAALQYFGILDEGLPPKDWTSVEALLSRECSICLVFAYSSSLSFFSFPLGLILELLESGEVYRTIWLCGWWVMHHFRPSESYGFLSSGLDGSSWWYCHASHWHAQAWWKITSHLSTSQTSLGSWSSMQQPE